MALAIYKISYIRSDPGMSTSTQRGKRWALAAGCKEAAEAAAEVMSTGGNVVDAAIAGSAVQCVAQPHAVALGGDLFALVRLGDGPVQAVNATGFSPAAATMERYRNLGHRTVPLAGPLSVQVPGLVAGWDRMIQRWGSKTLAELLTPAIDLATNGVRIGPLLRTKIEESKPRCSDQHGWSDVFLRDGRVPEIGDRLVQNGLARTLRTIAQHGARGFYEGWIANDIARTVREAGGLLDEADLAAAATCAEVVAPLTIRWRGLDVITQPPVSQGVVLLRALLLLSDKRSDATAAAAALARAFAERLATLGDGPEARSRAEAMLAGMVPATRSQSQAHAETDTTTLAIMDDAGNGVALINSVFNDFGCGVVGRESGVLLNNRLTAFFLDESHPNRLLPRRRTMHTLHSVMVSDAEGLRLVGGSPGGDLQPQVNLQVLLHLDAGSALEEAVTAPRWALADGTHPLKRAPGDLLLMEPGLSPELIETFKAAGYRMEGTGSIGSAKWVQRGVTDELIACADDRREGVALAN